MAPRPIKRPIPRTPGPAPNRAPSRIPAAGLIHGRNAVLEAARAGRVVKVYQASGLGHDPRLDELAQLARIEVVPPDRLRCPFPGVSHGGGAGVHPPAR